MLNRCPTHKDKGLWMRPVYWDGFKDASIRMVVRRRDRTNPADVTFIPPNTDMPVRFIKQAGRRDLEIQPELYPDDGTTVQVYDKVVKKIEDLTPEDLASGTPDVQTSELVRYHIALIDNTGLPPLDELVTLYFLRHMPKAVDPEDTV